MVARTIAALLCFASLGHAQTPKLQTKPVATKPAVAESLLRTNGYVAGLGSLNNTHGYSLTVHVTKSATGKFGQVILNFITPDRTSPSAPITESELPKLISALEAILANKGQTGPKVTVEGETLEPVRSTLHFETGAVRVSSEAASDSVRVYVLPQIDSPFIIIAPYTGPTESEIFNAVETAKLLGELKKAKAIIDKS
ncbi:MAG: hypothetical protein EOP84_28185 [Verrucomicrobiaceae bacterium]|nr:MAG: hypothetical protein EOP84_28185 [Verrucomicrobiaceae bacterium]